MAKSHTGGARMRRAYSASADKPVTPNAAGNRAQRRAAERLRRRQARR